MFFSSYPSVRTTNPAVLRVRANDWITLFGRGLLRWLPHSFLLALTILFAFLIVKDVGQPLVGFGDTNQWLYQSYYFAEHLHLLPIPHLELVSDDSFYPYGVNNVFRPWNFESAYFYTAAYSLFGNGPWLQWYYLISVFLCAMLSYVLIRREYGVSWGLLIAVAVSFGNLNAVSRYPYHYGYGVVHWMTLSILLDFLILSRFVRREPISLRLVLLKFTCLILCFGHDLGYVCGMALTSTLITSMWIGVLAIKRLGFAPAVWREAIGGALTDFRAGGLKHWRFHLVLAFVAVVVAILYLPLVGQLVIAAHTLDTGVIGALETHPCRMFFPVIPGIDQSYLRGWFPEDFVEEVYDLRPGIFFVLGGLGALAYSVFDRGTWTLIVPFVTTLVLFLLFDPSWSPLATLPWCEHARTNNRFSLALPALFLVIMLSLPWGRLSGRRWRIAFGVGVMVFAVEMGSAYAHLASTRHVFLMDVDQEFVAFTDLISQTPGEAVMEWPFMVAGGNGVGLDHLAFYYKQLLGAEGMQPFHKKKAMGGYLGRLAPVQIEPILNAGWQHILTAVDQLPLSRITRQRRDFTTDEWAFLEEYFRRGDFCGLVIYVDLLPEETVRGFYERFGPPIAATNFLFAGRLEFIQKPESWRRDVDRNSVLALALDPPKLVQHYEWDGEGYWYCGFGYGTDTPIIGDWNGDGVDEIGVRRDNLFILDSNGNGTWDGNGEDRVVLFGEPTDTPVVGDFNGDGADDIGLHRDDLFILDLNGNGRWDGNGEDRAVSFGANTDTPIIGDWNGDGIDDIGFHRDNSFVLDSNGNGRWDTNGEDRVLLYGETTDTPIVGDWDGDGVDNIGLRRDNLFILDSNGNGKWDANGEDHFFPFGAPCDTPIAGDWNADGRDQPGLHRRKDKAGRFLQM